MKVALYGQPYNEEVSEYVLELIDELKIAQAEIHIEKEFCEFLDSADRLNGIEIFDFENGLDKGYDLFVSFGGDGTILRAVTYIGDLGIPIVGVNTGRLGFLSTFHKEDVRKLVQEFTKGNYTLVDRSLLAVNLAGATTLFGDLNFALNEVTVSRKDTTSMITVETCLNGEYLTSYWADGLIIATPTGSTGYSLSCGGPVMTPTARTLVITPIAPHNLNARPLVISDDTQIRLTVSGREEQHLLSLDSRITSVDIGTEITISKAYFTVKMVAFTSESFFKTIRNKLLWGQDKRN